MSITPSPNGSAAGAAPRRPRAYFAGIVAGLDRAIAECRADAGDG